MKELMIRPAIYRFDTAKEFVSDFQIGAGDLLITNRHIYNKYLEPLCPGCDVIFRGDYGRGEPSDDMAEAMYKDIKGEHKRIIAIGGGSILDISKIFALKEVSPVPDLYDGKIRPEKDKELILVPTTCGTGSEVTNIAILALHTRGTKKGLAVDEMYADAAVLVPEFLEDLPLSVFATSSIDALVHAVESSLSPNATETSRMFGYKAIEMILSGYMKMAQENMEAGLPLLSEFLMASLYAGVAFGNAGCAAVHAMSYPLGATYHVPHGESNYAMFTGVMKNYMEIKQDGEIVRLNAFMAQILRCSTEQVYDKLEELLNLLIPKKPLHEYGMKREEIEAFTDSVIENQQRLLKNNFVYLDRERMIKIYSELF